MSTFPKPYNIFSLNGMSMIHARSRSSSSTFDTIAWLAYKNKRKTLLYKKDKTKKLDLQRPLISRENNLELWALAKSNWAQRPHSLAQMEWRSHVSLSFFGPLIVDFIFVDSANGAQQDWKDEWTRAVFCFFCWAESCFYLSFGWHAVFSAHRQEWCSSKTSEVRRPWAGPRKELECVPLFRFDFYAKCFLRQNIP